MTARMASALAALTLVVSGAVLVSALPVAKATLVRTLAWPARLARASAPRPAAPLADLAATQVGYPPAGLKAFTADRPFTAFSVVDAQSGAVAWRSTTAPRRVASEDPDHAAGAWIGDFSAFATPGRYRLKTGDGAVSYPFDIATTVFDPAVRATQRAFYYQRAFTALEAPYAEGPWVHASDAPLAPPGIRRGWHDAGDYSLYNMTTVSSLFWLLEAFSDFAPTDDATNIPESGNGVPDLLDEARWGLDWLQATQVASGAFRNSTCLTTYGAYGRNPIAGAAPYVHGEPGTLATARAVGVLAYASVVYAPFDATFAQAARDAALRGWRFLEAHPNEHSDGATCAAYRQDGDAAAGRATRMFAAAGLLVATGDARFRDAVEAHAVALDGDPSPYRFAAYASLLYRRAAAADATRLTAIDAALAQHAADALAAAEAHPFGWTGRYVWGSIAIGFERSGGFLVRRCLDARSTAQRFCQQAVANLDYLFGRNALRVVYMSGLPGVTHARQHAFHQWLASLDARPFVFPGAVAGGPNAEPLPEDGSRPLAWPRAVWGYWGDPAWPRSATTRLDGRYTDNDSWTTNELAIAWQAVTLYNLYFGQWAARRPSGAGGEVLAHALDDALGRVPVAVGIGR